MIARGSAWAFSLLLGSGLAAAAGEATGAFVVAAAAVGYLALSWWLLHAGRLVPGLLGGRREGPLLLALLIAVLAAAHAAGLLPAWSGSGGAWVAALLALPTLRRVLLGARLLGPVAPAVGLALLVLGFWLLSRGLACGFVGLVAAAEVLMVAAAAGRMIRCGEEAAETLLAGAM